MSDLVALSVNLTILLSAIGFANFKGEIVDPMFYSILPATVK